MSQVTDAITALTTAVDNLAANGEASTTDAADAAAIQVQTDRIVALTAPAVVPPVVTPPASQGLGALINPSA